MRKEKPKHSFNRINQTACRFLKQTHKAIIAVNALGFTVLNIDFTAIKPRIEIDVSHNPNIAKALIKEGKAYRYSYGQSEALGKWAGYYTMLEGIRVWWRQANNH